MKTTPIHPRFGVEVHDLDLTAVTAEHGYPALRDLFERHSLLLFRDQHLDDDSHLALGRLFGPIEVRSKDPAAPAEMSTLTNRDDAGVIADEDDLRVLNHKANQLWHTDSTFLSVPALANLIAARVVTSTGGETELASTRAAFADMPEDLKDKARGAVLRHRYGHSRLKVSEALARQQLFTMWEDTAWRAVWPNPVTGEEALYIASHAFGVVGMADDEGRALIDELMAFATRPDYVYTHRWRVGDVLIWDERATVHRGRPWPYDEERTLASICVTVTEDDGLDTVRPAA